MRSLVLAAVVSLFSAPAWAGPLASAARLNVGPEQLAVGRRSPGFAAILDCASSQVQHTILQCVLKPAVLPTTSSVGRRVQSASLTLNFKGDVVNMSVAYDPALSFDILMSDYKAALASDPKVQYWADDAHLYASYIWIDGETEVEITRTLKGPAAGGGVRVFVSSLSGNTELSPDDAP
ncbi:MAG: hypothetical protein ACHQ51_10750 [Elusimicrobiota bacterium]